MPVILALTLAICPSALALPGPALQTPRAELAHALTCAGDLGSASRIPVLLIHGTGDTPARDFGANLLQLTPAWGFPYCYLTLPNRGETDMQPAVEYVVAAIRSMAARSHSGKIAVVGHSQGGFLPLYALKFWPDLAGKVADSIGYAPAAGRGTTFADTFCAMPCTPAFHQFRPGSALLAAFNRQPYPVGPTYTSFLTQTDEIVTPQPAASTLPIPGAHTYNEQQLCPGDTAEHVMIVNEQPFAALTRQLISNPGRPIAETGKPPCGLLPGAASVAATIPGFLASEVQLSAQYATNAEPPLRCYLNPNCPHPKLLPGLTARTAPTLRRRGPFRFTTAGTLQLPAGATRQCAGTVTIIIQRGRHTLSKRTVTVGPNCQFSSATTLKRARIFASSPRRKPRTATLQIQARYSGDAELLATHTPWRPVRAK